MLLCCVLFLTDMTAQIDQTSDLTEISTQVIDIPVAGVFIAPNLDNHEGRQDSNFSTNATKSTGVEPVQSAVERSARNLSNKATVDYEHPVEQRIKDWERPDEQTAESRLYAYQSPDVPDGGTTVSDADPDEGTFFANLMAWFRANLWAVILGAMGFLKIIVNLTPTEKDDKIFAWLDNFISSIIPSRKTGGGTHSTA